MSGTRPLRVAYVVPDLGIGGAERHVTTLMSQLDRERFEPSVVCLGREGELFASLAAGGVPAVALHRSRRQALVCLIELMRELRRTRPDVVLVRGYNAEVLGRLASWVARVPHRVVWVHNCGDLEPRGLLRRISDLVLGGCTDAYFGVAHAQQSYLEHDLGYPASKIRIIHNGVDPSPFQLERGREEAALGFEEDEPVVGILAALRPEKDHETFLHAAAMVTRRHPTARFLVVGDGPRRAELEALAASLGLGDRVLFTGARGDVPAVLAAMDVFVLSSFTIECFPMALLEAMASSLPAVCTDVGGVPELLADGVTGYLVPPHDPAAMAEKLDLMLGSAEVRRCMGAAARDRLEREFTLATSVAETEEALTELVAPSVAVPARPIRLTLVLDETFIGGVELLMLEVFKHFDPRVVRPRLICLRAAGPLVEDYRSAGFRVDVLERRGRFDLQTLPRLVRALRSDGGTDVVLVTHHHRAALALGRVAARLAGVPVDLVAVHDMDLTSVGKRCLPRWAVATLGFSDALVLLSPSQGDYLHREEQVGSRPWSRTREVVIANGVVLRPAPDEHARAAARDRLGLGPTDFVVGIVARLSAQKAHQVLLVAFAQVHSTRPDAHLVVVGGGDREAELRELAAELGLADCVHFLGVRRDVADLLPAFDVSCLSSVHEGVPVAAIESMAAALPMVATDCGSLRDMVVDGKHGYLVEVGDSEAFAERLARLADDPDLRRELGAEARRWVEARYRIEQTAEGYERLLQELVDV